MKTKTKKYKKAKSVDDYDNLFNFIKIFFNKNVKYNNTTNYQRQKHRFMINRFFAIQYPTSAQALNQINTNPTAVVNTWHRFANRFSKTPGWIFTKTKKTKKNKKLYTPSPDALNRFLKQNKISIRDYQDLYKYNYDNLVIELKNIETFLENE